MVEQIMMWMHQKKVSLNRLTKLVPDILEEIPDSVLIPKAELRRFHEQGFLDL